MLDPKILEILEFNKKELQRYQTEKDAEVEELLDTLTEERMMGQKKIEKEFKQILESILLHKEAAVAGDDLNGHLSVFNVMDLINTFQDGKKKNKVYAAYIL